MKKTFFMCAAVAAGLSVFCAPVKGVAHLSPREAGIVSIAALAAKGDLESLAESIADGLDDGLTVNEIGEVLLQLYAYAGFPRSLNAQNTLSRVLAERRAAGVQDNYGVEPLPLADGIDKYDFGREKINELQNADASQPRPSENGYAAATDIFLKEHLFADIVGRETLSFKDRELATCSVLSALYTVNPQLLSHFGGAMNMGNTPDMLFDMTKIVAKKIGRKEGRNAREVLEQAVERRIAASSSGGKLSANVPPRNAAVPFDLKADVNSVSVFAPGELFESENFSGRVWLSRLNAQGVAVANVTFEPGCRNNWHTHHTGGQLLLATGGRGWVQLEGQDAVELSPGGVFLIPPEVKHWHGAADDSWFSHIAVEIPGGSGGTEWHEPVDDARYTEVNAR